MLNFSSNPRCPRRGFAWSVLLLWAVATPIQAEVGELISAGQTGTAKATNASDGARPNILYIISDDQGWPDLGCMGLKPIETPHLDRLAAEGVRATSFYVTWPACTPSRGSLLTGRFPQRNGLYDMVRNDMVNYGHRFSPEEYAVSPEMTLGLDPRERTLGDMLKQAGYRTGVVGKWDMGQARRYLPLQRGFDFFYGHGNNGIDYYTHERYGVPSMFEGNQRTQTDRGVYATDLFKQKALDFIRRGGDQPWFLYLAFNAPHGASSFASAPGEKKAGEGVQAPEEYIARYRGKLKEEKLTKYYAAVTCMDAAIGEIMKELESKQLLDQTLICFQSDNGGSGNGGNAPWRGQKGMMTEGGLRVPFLARWPGHLPAGQVSDAFLTSMEVMPMLATVSNAKLDPGVSIDGFDMLPILKGERSSPRTEMFWQRRGDKAARIGDWKWIDSEKAKGLFNLADDPGENSDLSKTNPDQLKQMQARFEAWQREMEACEPRGPFRDF